MTKPIIIAVDDEVPVLNAVSRDLRTHFQDDYRIVKAESAEDALEAVKEFKRRNEPIALFLVDQRMPSMSGVEFLAEAIRLYPETKRVLLTAYADTDAAIASINEIGLDYYLSKPWDPPEERLYPVLDDLLSDWVASVPVPYDGIRVAGTLWSARSHDVKDFLARSQIPYQWLDIERNAEARDLVESTSKGQPRIPMLFFPDGTTLVDPDFRTLVAKVGMPTDARSQFYDLIIIGGGPAGLAAAVYGASEGLRTLLVDARSPGGQAGASSRIENYLGFPSGVSGSELTRRAVAQARRLGAEFLVPAPVVALSSERPYKRLTLEDGSEIVARSVIAATGVTYREHPAAGMADFAGAGVYYGTATTEAQSCRGRHVMIVGGGNSAGQSAVYLSRFAYFVELVVRREDLTATMSRYLIDQIEALPNVRLCARTVVERVEGADHLERATLRSLDDDTLTVRDLDALFVFIGTRPHSDWLPPTVLRDAKGLVLTGRDTALGDGFEKTWKERREPAPLETTVPGVFAAGDVRASAMNRVASAVGEGAMAVRLVSDYLATI